MPSAERKYMVICTENEVISLLVVRIKEIVEVQKKSEIERPDEISFPQLKAICNLLFAGPGFSDDTVNYLAVKLATEDYGSFLPCPEGGVFKLFLPVHN